MMQHSWIKAAENSNDDKGRNGIQENKEKVFHKLTTIL